MPTLIPQHVQPGDLISSDMMNYILDQLDLIDQRVAKLESGGTTTGQGTIITGFDPRDQVSTGQVLSIKGSNFAFPPTDNDVTIDGKTPITVFRQDSTGSELNFVVPISITPPAGGKPMTITVRNKQTNLSDSALYRIMPGVQAPGNPQRSLRWFPKMAPR